MLGILLASVLLFCTLSYFKLFSLFRFVNANFGLLFYKPTIAKETLFSDRATVQFEAVRITNRSSSGIKDNGNFHCGNAESKNFKWPVPPVRGELMVRKMEALFFSMPFQVFVVEKSIAFILQFKLTVEGA